MLSHAVDSRCVDSAPHPVLEYVGFCDGLYKKANALPVGTAGKGCRAGNRITVAAADDRDAREEFAIFSGTTGEHTK